VLFEALHPHWQSLLTDQRELLAKIACDLEGQPVVPSRNRIMAAFEHDPETKRVLIIGQDPYPNPEHATGLAFAVPRGTKPLPPTLANIYRELASDLGDDEPSATVWRNAEIPYGAGALQPDLAQWADRGVMLMNRHLSTRAGESAAHFHLGWQRFTDAAVTALAGLQGRNLVAILWGRKAQQLSGLLGEAEIIESPHPSPLSSYRGFFGSRPFSRANRALVARGLQPIDWSGNA
jgi:uracil-DNA glycosylase